MIACTLLEGALATGVGDTLHAQENEPSAGSATITLTVRLDVASRLKVSADGSTLITSSDDGSTHFALPVRVRANLHWRLLVARPATAGATPDLEVLDVRGAWRRFGDGVAVAVTESTGPTDLHRLWVRLRVPRRATLTDVTGLRLELEPVEPPR